MQSVEKVILSVISMLAGMKFPHFVTPTPAHHMIYLGICAAVGTPLVWTLDVEPNLESGANIDCCKLYRDNYKVRSGFACTSRPPAVLNTELR